MEKNRQDLKSYFQTGDRPTEGQFAELIDSILNKVEDEITVESGTKNIGIGFATAPTTLGAKLEVNGGIKASSIFLSDGANTNTVDLVLTTVAGANGAATWESPSVVFPRLWTEVAATGNIHRDTGNVGIGLTTPTEKLQVSGRIKANSIQLTSGAGNNQVLTADSSGIATWRETPWLFANLNDAYYNASGKVGIGTSSPVQKLSVIGTVRAASSAIETDYLQIRHDGSNAYLEKGGGGDLYITDTLRLKGKTLEFLNTGRSIFIGEGAGLNDDLSTNQNVFIGYQAGYSNTEGNSNTFLGSYAGKSNTEGSFNTFLGRNAGSFNTTGNSNTFLGTYAGYSNTEGNSNTFLGHVTGYKTTEGSFNTFLGGFAGQDNTTGSSNTFLGSNAGLVNTSGSYNTFLGSNAGQNNETGINNTFLGRHAGLANTTGSYNTFLGTHAGYRNEIGNVNVFLGNRAGYSELGSNKLYIDNSGTYTPLIYGDFNTNELFLNGTTAITSDQKTKEDIITLSPILQKIKQVNPVSYLHKKAKEKGRSVGFVAQEIRDIFPEVVSERIITEYTEEAKAEMELEMKEMEEAMKKGEEPKKRATKERETFTHSILGIKYNELIPIAIKGIQEQQEIIERQERQITALNARYSNLVNRLKTLES